LQLVPERSEHHYLPAPSVFLPQIFLPVEKDFKNNVREGESTTQKMHIKYTTN